MENINEQFSQVKNIWDNVYQSINGNTEIWQPYLPNTSLDVLNESVGTLSNWIERTRAPNGFSPAYHLAKSLASIYIPNLLSAVQQVQGGQYSHFQSFITHLINTLAAVHTMTVYAPKTEQDSLVADFSAELSQALTLLNTTQRELSEKIKSFERCDNLTQEIEKYYAKVQEIETNILDSKNNVEEYKTEAAENCAQIHELYSSSNSKHTEFIDYLSNCSTEYKKKLNSHTETYQELLANHEEEYAALVEKANRLSAKLTSMTESLTTLQSNCSKQQEIINSILPRAASAGLAAAFSQRENQLKSTKWVWLIAFVISLSFLFYISLQFVGGFSFTDGFSKSNDYLYSDRLFTYLPIAAPLIWLGWFSAIQYGNTIRVQEDYAFKEATSKAFQGYKDHMEHLSNVDLDEARSAMALLSENTINILAREPLRIYGKTNQDASPLNNLPDMMKLRNLNKGKKQETDS